MRSQRRAARRINEQRWRMVGPLQPLEQRLGNAPALFPDDRWVHSGGYLYLTTDRLMVAFVEPPWSEASPGVSRFYFRNIKRLIMDDRGYLCASVERSSGRRVSLIAFPVPNAFSSGLLWELRTRWEAFHDQTAEGTEAAWQQWTREPYPVGPWSGVLDEFMGGHAPD